MSMSGRHRYRDIRRTVARGGGGGDFGGGSFPSRTVAVVAVLAVLFGVGTWVVVSRSGGSGGGSSCSAGTATLDMAVSPDITPAVNAVLAAQPVRCGTVTVTPRSPAEVAGLLSGQSAAADALPRPDVWIPDTSMWASEVHSTSAGALTIQATPTSIAMSPEVIAMPTPVATGLTSLAVQPSWAGLLPSFESNQPLKMVLPNPTTSGPGLAALAAVAEVTTLTQGAAGLTDLAQAVRTMVPNTQPDTTTIMSNLPSTEATSASGQGVDAFPTTEQAVWKYDNSGPAVSLSVIYPSEGATPMDYPFVESTTLKPAQQQLATQVMTALTSPQGRAALQANGFRTPDGTAGAAIARTSELTAARPALGPVPTADQVRTLLGLWSASSAPIQMLGVVDLSGSMNDQVPGANASRLQLTVNAAEEGNAFFPDSSSVGLWTFTTGPANTNGATIRNTVIPLGPMTGQVGPVSRRDASLAALNALQPQPGSRTGLYDTLIAAYQAVLQNWSPAEANTVVIFTDGLNPDLNNISLQQTISQLQALKNPAKPIQLVIIAVGGGAQMGPLNQITTAAGDGSGAYNPMTSQDIQTVFFQAVASNLAARTGAQG